MTLPFDFSTALWWRSEPVWEWEALPPPAGCEAPGDADGPATPAATPAHGTAAPPAPPPGEQREGYHLVFKGYEIAASVFWYPADSPLSRPWQSHDLADDRRSQADEGDAADAAARAALLRAAADDVGPA